MEPVQTRSSFFFGSTSLVFRPSLGIWRLLDLLHRPLLDAMKAWVSKSVAARREFLQDSPRVGKTLMAECSPGLRDRARPKRRKCWAFWVGILDLYHMRLFCLISRAFGRDLVLEPCLHAAVCFFCLLDTRRSDNGKHANKQGLSF